MTAQKIAWALPGATASSSSSVGQPRAGLDTTLAADPALGATNLKVASVTTVALNDFIRIGAAGVAATEANSEVVKVINVGTSGGGGTGLDIENSAGGGCLLDHAQRGRGQDRHRHDPRRTGARRRDEHQGRLRDRPDGGRLRADRLRRALRDPAAHRRRDHGPGRHRPHLRHPAHPRPRARRVGHRSHGSRWPTIRPVIGRIASAAYQDLVLTDLGADGATMIVTLENAMSAETQELSFDDDPANPLGLTLKFTGHYHESTPTQVPLTIAMA